MEKILIFDIWGDYGHFKKYYTTTSPLTFSFPPRPTIAGIISAVIGLDKNEYLKYFLIKDAYIALKILNPIAKIRMGQNLIDTKSAKLFSRIAQRSQIRTEYVKEPKYRIYFWHINEEIYKKLGQTLNKHECVYTISMGLSGLLANYSFIGEFGIKKLLTQKQVEIDSVIPSDQAKIAFEEGKEYFSTTMPVEMIPERIITKYCSIGYERKGDKIICEPKLFYQIENGENIIFL